MRKMWCILALTCVAALVPCVTADAGGKGAVKADLLVAEYPTGRPPSVVVVPKIDAGDVVFNANANDVMNVTVKLKDGPPNTTFQVFAIRTAIWGSTADQPYAMTTNRKGKATLHFQRPIPDDAPDPVEIAVVVRTPDLSVVFRTYLQEVPLK